MRLNFHAVVILGPFRKLRTQKIETDDNREREREESE
jgi:hypothetical protein